MKTLRLAVGAIVNLGGLALLAHSFGALLH